MTVADRPTRASHWWTSDHRYHTEPEPTTPLISRRAILNGLAVGAVGLKSAELDPVAWNPTAHTWQDITGATSAVTYAADFGVIADGVTDSSAKLNLAISDTNANGGGIVVLPPGTIAVASTITLLSNVRLVAGPGTTIKWIGASSGVIFQAGTLVPIVRSGLVGGMTRIDCNFKTLWVFDLHSVQSCAFGDVEVVNGSATTIIYRLSADTPTTVGGYGSTPVRNVIWNTFGRLLVPGTCLIGYQLRGMDSASVITLNRFGPIELTDCRDIGIRLISWSDNNVFDGWSRISLTADNAIGVVFNDSPSDGVLNTTVTAGGSGYTSAPAVGFSGGGGSGAVAFATIANGAVTGIFMVNPGSGYATPPAIALTGGGGSGATATCSLGGPTVNVGVQSNVFEHLAVDTLAGHAGRQALLFNQQRMNTVLAFHNTPAAEGGVIVDLYGTSWLVNMSGQNSFWNDVRVNLGRVGAGIGTDLAMLTARGKTSFLLSAITGGTVATTSGSANVVGTGTRFLQDLAVGDRMTISAVTHVITSITDETHLVCDATWGSTASGLDATIDKAILRVDKPDGTRAIVVDSRGFLGILRDPGTYALEIDASIASAFFGVVGIGGSPDSTVASAKASANSATVAAIFASQSGSGPAILANSYEELIEISDPAAPVASRGRLYTRDNGSGKAQLVVRFPTGAVQVLATEP